MVNQVFVRGEPWPENGYRFELVKGNNCFAQTNQNELTLLFLVGDEGNATNWSDYELRLQAFALGATHFQRPEGLVSILGEKTDFKLID